MYALGEPIYGGQDAQPDDFNPGWGNGDSVS